jgi:hypothetical protein
MAITQEEFDLLEVGDRVVLAESCQYMTFGVMPMAPYSGKEVTVSSKHNYSRGKNCAIRIKEDGLAWNYYLPMIDRVVTPRQSEPLADPAPLAMLFV